MGRVFAIAEGLENLGALKTGGQGSVYKGKRIGEIFTAVKLLPTPIASEDPSNKHYIDFKNEVEKLKKVNEAHNPNVVKIISSGITETGGFPFIEMEYIEGPDLGELLKPPHDPVFTIKESIKVAEHLAHALSHCHTRDVKHGDIKSNNVKYNTLTGNYVLLDFGLAVMSDEQRRTSLRHAGAIEFMAPEQNEGHMLFQTDVYSFGIVLFELLAGQVPFPQQVNSETARNEVRLAHMEEPVPDLLLLRRKNIPHTWPAEKKQWEIRVPAWMLQMVYKCLEKDPEKRYPDGKAVYEYIVLNSTMAARKEEMDAGVANNLQQDNETLLLEKERLQQHVLIQQRELELLREQLSQKQTAGAPLGTSTVVSPKNRNGVSPGLFYTLLFITLIASSLAAYGLLFKNNDKTLSSDTTAVTLDSTRILDSIKRENARKSATALQAKKVKKKARQGDTSLAQPGTGSNVNIPQQDNPGSTGATTDADTENQDNTNSVQYMARSVAYFHNEPDASTRREAFINKWNGSVKALDERNGFIYVVYTNEEGQTSKGWLKKSDLIEVK